MRFVLVLLVALFTCATARASDQLGVLSIEEDPVAAGGRQQRLEERLRRAPSLVVRSSEEIAAKLRPAAIVSGGEAKEQIEKLLASAREPYWNADLVLAEARVAEAEILIDAMGSTPSVDRAEIVLWRTAILHGKGDAAAAERELRRLLAIAPDARVDLDAFPPSLAKLVEQVRTSLPDPVPVRFRGAPRGTRVWIDGRPSAEPWRVAPGSHRLHAEAPGFRSIDLSFDARGEVELWLGLAVTLKPHLEQKLRSFASGGEISRADRTDFWELLFRTNLDAFLVVARVEGGVQGRVFARGHASNASAVFPATSDGEKSLTEWAVATLMQSKGAPVAPRSTANEAPDIWTLHGGLGVFSRSWELRGSNDNRFSASGFSGTGPQLSGTFAYRDIVAEADVGFTTYALQEESIGLDDGASVRAFGGATAAAQVIAGYRFPFRRTAATPSLAVLAGGRFERHESDPLSDSDGDLGLLPSWERFSAEIGARAELPLVFASRPHAISLTGSLSPWSSWRITPSHALGRSPTGDPGFAWGGEADLGLSARWACRIGYEGRHSAARLKGIGAAPVDPALRNVRVTNQVHSLYLTIGREI